MGDDWFKMDENEESKLGNRGQTILNIIIVALTLYGIASIYSVSQVDVVNYEEPPPEMVNGECTKYEETNTEVTYRCQPELNIVQYEFKPKGFHTSIVYNKYYGTN